MRNWWIVLIRTFLFRNRTELERYNQILQYKFYNTIQNSKDYVIIWICEVSRYYIRLLY